MVIGVGDFELISIASRRNEHAVVFMINFIDTSHAFACTIFGIVDKRVSVDLHVLYYSVDL